MSLVDIQFLGSGDAFGSGGRFNTCFYVKGSRNAFLIDCGASSLIAMKKFNVDPNSIDTIFLTHLHGDHFGGVIFFLMEARYLGKRKRPLTIAGPTGTKKRIIETMNALYPGCWDKGVDFDVYFIELNLNKKQIINNVAVTPFQAKHLQDGNDFILRTEVDGRVITYSGDSGWTDTLIPASEDADLFICECFHFDEDCEFHLDYQTIKRKADGLKAKNIILTHLGPEALKRQNEITMQVAFDGMKVSF